MAIDYLISAALEIYTCIDLYKLTFALLAEAIEYADCTSATFDLQHTMLALSGLMGS